MIKVFENPMGVVYHDSSRSLLVVEMIGFLGGREYRDLLERAAWAAQHFGAPAMVTDHTNSATIGHRDTDWLLYEYADMAWDAGIRVIATVSPERLIAAQQLEKLLSEAANSSSNSTRFGRERRLGMFETRDEACDWAVEQLRRDRLDIAS